MEVSQVGQAGKAQRTAPDFQLSDQSRRLLELH